MSHKAHTALALAVLLVLAGCTGGSDGMGPSGDAAPSGGQAESVGVSVGGAQDAGAFRANVRNGYVPQPTAVTHEGLFHDYYFDTGRNATCEAAFCPSYSRAVSPDPLSGERERYLTVGLNSGLSRGNVGPDRLNLVVVVDTSGSMSESMRRYHYDGASADRDADRGPTTKMAAARSALRTLAGKLGPRDRLGVVAYDDRARVVRELAPVSDRDRLRSQVGGLRADGSTNLAAGMETADLVLEPHRNPEPGVENRVVYLTDAMPNAGQTGGQALGDRLRRQAEAGVHATFVGVGVDFNTRLVETISSVRGANYYSVHSAAAFEERMTDGFRNMVAPLAYNLTLRVDSVGYDVAEVYGVPDEAASTGELLQMDTLFPSRKRDGRTEGGVVLLRLERPGDGAGAVRLTASYETPDGESHRTVRRVRFPAADGEYYGTTGVRKAVALSRYADLLRNWAAYERTQARGGSPEAPPDGVESRQLGQWEQTSVEMRVSPVYRERVAAFRSYLSAERNALGADRMSRDLAVLDRLLAAGGADGDGAGGSDGASDGDTGDGVEAARAVAAGVRAPAG